MSYCRWSDSDVYAFFGCDGRYHIMDGRDLDKQIALSNPISFYRAMRKLKEDGAKIDQPVMDAIRREIFSPRRWFYCFWLRLQ